MSIRATTYKALRAITKTLKPTRSKSRPHARAYSAAAVGRLTADWNAPDSTADMEISMALRVLRARAQDMERNNDYAKRYFHLLTTNVLGHKGVSLQIRAKGSDGKPDKFANALIETKWKAWGKPGCTVDGQLSWNDVQQLVLRSVARDGEIFIYFPPSWKHNNAGFAMQLIEADHVDVDFNMVLNNGNTIRMGIERDKYRRPVAYHVFTVHPSEQRMYSGQKLRERLPAEDVIHLRRPERVDETRSAPWIVAGLAKLKQMDAAEEAEVVAWRIAASKMGFYIPGDDAEYDGEDTTEDGDPISEAEPGIFEKLKKGWDFKEWDPGKPSSTVESFEKAMLRGVASGWNVSYVSLANNLEGVSFSSIRSGELLDRAHWRVLQTWLIEHFNEPVREKWLKRSLLTGYIPLPPGKFEKFNAPIWRPRGWEWVNPRDESTAAKQDLEIGARSLQRIVGDRGDDLEEIFAENKEAKELAAEYGVTLSVFPDEPGDDKSNGDTEGVDVTDDIKTVIDAYGVGVRAGSITPQEEDEQHFRDKMGLPIQSSSVTEAWEDDSGYRRPITLISGSEAEAASTAGQDNSEEEQ